MDFSFLVRGLAIGFSVAAVVGPIGMLCIQRTLHKGLRYGLVTGLGAATADGIYGGIAAFGLTIISSFLVSQQTWIRLLGGAFLVYLGIRAMFTRPAEQAAQARGGTFPGIYLSTLLLTLTNPLTILSFAAVFAGLGVGTTGRGSTTAALITAGVFLGSCAWWLLLSGGLSLLRTHIKPGWLLWINRGAGLALTIFGVIAVLSVMR
jgi:threonine/homoserine/homoserine lactone efflux protein